MRLLFITPQVPWPPDKGTRIRNHGLISELAKRHEVGVLTFAAPDEDAALDDLARTCRVVGAVRPPRRPRLRRFAQALLDPRPDLALRLRDSAFSVALRDVLVAEPWDILHVEALEMAPHWLASRPVAPPAILDEHNCEWVLQARAAQIDWGAWRPIGAAYSAIQTRKLRAYEGRAARLAAGVACVSVHDAASLRTAGEPRALAVVPNGVDTRALARRQVEPDGDVVLFSGTMDYRPNVDGAIWLSNTVWPLVRARRRAARLVLAGRDPSAAIRRLHGRQGVEVTGTVDDMSPHFEAASVYVAPLRFGGGVRLKLLEAFARGVPVACTSLAAEGIDLVGGEHALVADDPTELADAIVRLLEGADLRRRLASAARTLVEDRYDWRNIVPVLERLHDQVVEQSGSRRGRIVSA